MLVQQTSAEEERQALLAGDVFLGLANGDYGQYLQTGWKDYGSVSAIDVATGKRVWKFDTPAARARRADDDGLRHRLRRRRRRELPRLRRQDRQGALDVPDRRPDRRRPLGLLGQRHRVHRDRRRRHADLVLGRHGRLAGAGLLARRQHRRSRPPPTITAALQARRRQPHGSGGASTAAPAARVEARRRCGLRPRTSRAARAIFVQTWNPNTSNTQDVAGPRDCSAGQPVVGRGRQHRRLDRPAPTDATGAFTYPVDITTPLRHVATDRRRRPTRRSAASPSPPRSRATLLGRERRNQRRLRGDQALGSQRRQRQRRHHGPPRRTANERRAAAGAALQLRADGHDHRRERQPGPGRDRDDADERPPVLDAVAADGANGELRLVPRRCRPGRGQPGADAGRRRGRRDRRTPSPRPTQIKFAKL